MILNVDNLNLLVEDIIKESVSDKVWHYTRPTNMLDILKTNICYWFIYLIGIGNICMLTFKIN